MRMTMTAMAAVLVLATGCTGMGRRPLVPEVMETRTPITFSGLLAVERARADTRIAYGADPLQFGELWLPQGRGPHPVAVLIHGGCWRADLPGLELMDYMAADLRDRGYAVWNIEYRRIGHPGGGYPGTFQDVAGGLDHLRAIAPQYRLNLRRVVVSGHSAGGHLALWAASRNRLPKSSPLRSENPLPVRGVVALAGIADLESYRASGPDACGGPETIDGLVDAASAAGRDLYADTSPPAMLPLGMRQVVVSGVLDPIVPARFGQAYAAAAAGRGDRAVHVELTGAGHFELIDPTSAIWPRIAAAFADLSR